MRARSRRPSASVAVCVANGGADATSGRAGRSGDRATKSGKSEKRTPKDPVKAGKKKTRDGTGDRSARRRRKNRLPVAASVQGGVKP